jgi:hypothetical protein
MKKNTETLIDDSKDIGLEINVEKTKYMLLSHCNQGVLKCGTVQIFGNDSNKSKSDPGGNWRLNSGTACYHSVQNLLSSRLLSKNVQIRIYKTIILSVILNGCETWSLDIKGGIYPGGV